MCTGAACPRRLLLVKIELELLLLLLLLLLLRTELEFNGTSGKKGTK
jgi:hypothetical protein